MKSDKATKILDGELRYTIQQFKEDLRRDIDCEEDDDETREAHFNFQLNVIYLSSIDLSFRKIVKLLTTDIYPGLPKDITRDLVQKVRANSKEEIEVLRAIWMRKVCDFLALGASEERALKLTNRFLAEEL